MDFGCFTTTNSKQGVTLTSDPQNLMRSSVGTNEHYLSVLSKLFKPFVRYRTNGQTNNTNVTTGQPKNTTPLPTLCRYKMYLPTPQC